MFELMEVSVSYSVAQLSRVKHRYHSRQNRNVIFLGCSVMRSAAGDSMVVCAPAVEIAAFYGRMRTEAAERRCGDMLEYNERYQTAGDLKEAQRALWQSTSEKPDIAVCDGGLGE